MITRPKEKEGKDPKAKVEMEREARARVEKEEKADLPVKHKGAVIQLHTQARRCAPPVSRKSLRQGQSQRKMEQCL